ncbi:ABC transporter permease [Zhaonella formicivorans]|uniref:ABC transporter permease n=1 Tax=Zhaonella formicivorans TaxID=2528593 RepID=UPI0010EFACB8|nr:ABC transporter permease [Zhaonella formicivorans]
MIKYILTHQTEFLVMVRQHLDLTILALVLAMAVAIPLAILATRVVLLEGAVMTIGNIGQTIPSLVILGLGIPLVGIGFAPALLALFLRAVLPILINTFVGIKGVDHFVIEAARGMGMTENQILWKVQIPLTVPVMLAGVRTAAVQAVSLATLAAFAGGGTLGDLIQQGIMMVDKDLLLAGAVPTAILALLVDLLMGIVQTIATPKGLKIAE